VVEITVKDFYAEGFEAMEQVYQYWWKTCRDMAVFSRYEFQKFNVLCEFVTNFLTLPRTT
jgi:hypothetical protein